VALREVRFGALAVVQDVKTSDEIQRALKRLDPRLFVELQKNLDNELVWCVCLDVGGDEVPWTIYESRDHKNEPIPYLTYDVVNEIERRMKDPSTPEKIHAHNAARQESRHAAFDYQVEEVTREFQRRKRRGTKIVGTRGAKSIRAMERRHRSGDIPL
jgi:hypothetical protein